jgi:hypothetical protein
LVSAAAHDWTARRGERRIVRMVRHRGAQVAVVMTLVASAAVADPPAPAADSPAPASEATETTETPGATALPDQEAPARLLLAWPISPVAFSFSDARPAVPVAWDGAPYTFRAEAVWFERDSLSLRTTGASEAKLELDCRITCRPMVEQSAEVEARLQLGSPGKAVPEAHAFVRARSAAATGQSFTGPRPNNVLQFGIGGLLDL